MQETDQPVLKLRTPMRRKSTTKALKERYSRREILPIIHADEINGICPNIENIE